MEGFEDWFNEWWGRAKGNLLWTERHGEELVKNACQAGWYGNDNIQQEKLTKANERIQEIEDFHREQAVGFKTKISEHVKSIDSLENTLVDSDKRIKELEETCLIFSQDCDKMTVDRNRERKYRERAEKRIEKLKARLIHVKQNVKQKRLKEIKEIK